MLTSLAIRHAIPLALAAALGLGAIGSAQAATAAVQAGPTWAMFRGPARDGLSTETGLLKQWPAGGPTLAWKITGVGVGWSSVSIEGGKIFTMGDKDDSGCVVCFDLANGKQLWSAKVGKAGGNMPGTRSTPTIDGKLVYALGQFGDLVCLDAATGKEVWRKSFASDFGGKDMPGWNFTESVLVDGPLVVCTPGGSKGAMVALNKLTGATIWQSKEFTDPAAYSSIVPCNIGGVHQYVQLTANNVVGIAAETGKQLWSAVRKGATAVIPTPIVHDDLVYVTSGYGIGCNCFKISGSGEKFSASEVYANKDMINHHGGVIRVGDYVYGFSDGGGLTCMELKTGKVMWKDKSVGKGAMAYADGNLYLRSEGGKGSVALFEATQEGYHEKGRLDQPDRSDKASWAYPVVVGGRLFLRDQDVLLCYDVRAK